MLGQIHDERPWTLLDDDPMASLRGLSSLRTELQAAGVEVPDFVDATVDPVRNMTEWRAFLERFARIN
jgi:hypothetical protein